jgi:hypothetical protein
MLSIAAAILGAVPVLAALPPNTSVALWVLSAETPDAVVDGLPPRFVLLDDGRVFVGGTSVLATAHLTSKDVKPIEKQVDRARQIRDAGSGVTLGPGEQRYRLLLRKGPEIVAKGDPARASAGLRPLGALLQTLLSFDSAALRPFAPESYLLTVREGALVGGCRDWRFPTRLVDARKGTTVVPASAVAGWPTGGHAASVCEGDNHYTVTLRPLIPGESP